MASESNTIASIDPDARVTVDRATPPPEVAQSETEAPQPASQGKGETPETETQDDTPTAVEPEIPPKSSREKLIAKLIHAEDETPVEDDEVEVPAVKAEAAPAPKPAEKPVEVPEENDLEEVTNDQVKAMKPGEGRRKINRLVTRLKENEPLAKGYKEIVDLCEKHQFTPADYHAWVQLGIGLQDGDEAAVKRFTQLAEKMGIMPEATESTSPIPADLDEWLTVQAAQSEMSAPAVNELRKRLGIGAAPKPAPTKPTPTPRQATPRETPAADPIVVARSRATDQIGRIADEYEKKIGKENFAALEPRIQAALAKRQGSHPDAWPDIFRSAVETELAKVPKPAQPGVTLRPGTAPTPSLKPVFKSERERVLAEYTG